MTDKVQKIRNYACELLKDSQNGFGSASYNMLKMVIAYIDSLPEEPVSEDFGSMADKYHKEVLIGECQMNDDMAGHCRLSYYLGLKDGAKWQKKRDYIPLSDNINEVARQICNKVLNCEIDYKEDDVVLSDEEECVKAGIRWQMQKESIVSEDLEEAALRASMLNHNVPKELLHEYPYNGYGMRKFVDGAKWQKENLWKPADGDDLPEIDREVVVFTQNFPNDVGMMSVAIAHRPNPDGWDGKSLSTGKVEHYTPKTYDKGGWNIPNVKWWLDCLIPNMEE